MSLRMGMSGSCTWRYARRTPSGPSSSNTRSGPNSESAGDVLRDADPGRRVPEPLPEVHLQGDLDLHEAEERARHAVLAQDAEQRHRDHVARERVLARRDQRGELVEALEEHPALHGREPHARDLEEDRLEQPERRAALAAPVDRVAEVLPRHLDEGGHEAEEGGLDLARGLRGQGRHQRLEEDDEALDRLRRVAPRAAAAGLDEAVAALGEDGRGQVEKGPLRDRRLPGEDRGEKGGERLAVAARVRRALRGRRDGHPGVGDEPLELREEGRVERIVVGRVRDRDLLRAVYAGRAPRATTVAARPRIRVHSARPPMKRLLRHLSQLLPALLSLGLLAWVLRSADVGRALGLVHSLGWRLPFLLLPNLAAFLAETGGWWISFARLGPRPALPPPARGAGHGGRPDARPALGLGRVRDGPALPAQAPLRRADGDRHRGHRRAEVLRRRLPRPLPRPRDAPRLAAARPGLDRRHRPAGPALAAPRHLRRPRGRGARRRPRHRPRPRGRPRAPRARPARRSLARLLAGAQRAALPADRRGARRLLPAGADRRCVPSIAALRRGLVRCAPSRPGSSCGSWASTFPCPRPW